MPNIAIYTRSPYHVTEIGTIGQNIKCELFIWNEPASIPLTPTYTLSKPVPSNDVTSVSFDISEYCREYIKHISYNEVTVPTNVNQNEYCYCTVKTYINNVLENTYTFIAFDGYGYYSEGHNPVFNDVLMTEGTYLIEENTNSGGLSIYDDGTSSWSVVYKPLNGVGTTYTDGITGLQYVPFIRDEFKGSGGNIIDVFKGLTKIATYTFKEVCENKYEAIKCDFKNKFGAWQRLIFFKASYNTLDVNNNEFNLMSQDLNYNVLEARKKTFNTNGNEKIKVNTGWVEQEYSEVIKQLCLSEVILLDNVPCNIISKSMELPKNINKKNINYELQFEVATPVINNVQ